MESAVILSGEVVQVNHGTLAIHIGSKAVAIGIAVVILGPTGGDQLLLISSNLSLGYAGPGILDIGAACVNFTMVSAGGIELGDELFSIGAVNTDVTKSDGASDVVQRCDIHLVDQLDEVVAFNVNIELSNIVATDAFNGTQQDKAVLIVAVALACPQFHSNSANIFVCSDVIAGSANHSIEIVSVQASDIKSQEAIRFGKCVRVNTQTIFVLGAQEAQSNVGRLVGNAVVQSTGTILVQRQADALAGNAVAIKGKQIATVVCVQSDLAVVLSCQGSRVEHAGVRQPVLAGNALGQAGNAAGCSQSYLLILLQQLDFAFVSHAVNTGIA